MLGYSDLLLNSKLTESQRLQAAKVGQYVRRTKSLVASLISFARQTPAAKTLLDLNTLARTAVKLTEPQWQAQEIEVRTDLDCGSPKVLGDSNQLLQVCVQLVANCLHVLNEHSGKSLVVSTKRTGELCVVELATEPLAKLEPGSIPAAEEEDSLGLSACRGILAEHKGHISRERREDGRLILAIELPAAAAASPSQKDSTVPVLWQSRPYA